MTVQADFLRTLLSREDPVEWACEALDMLGHGSVAYVFAHPDSPELAIRLTDYPDAWFVYAMSLDDIEDELVDAHAPKVLAMGHSNGFFAAVIERLSEMTDDVWIEEVQAVLRGEPGKDVRFAAANPMLRRFLDRMTVSPTDNRSENFMLRGDTVVVNDPIGVAMSDGMLEIFVSKYGIDMDGAGFAP